MVLLRRVIQSPSRGGQLEVDARLAVCSDRGGKIEGGERDLAAAAAIKNGKRGARGEEVLNLLGWAAVLVDQGDGAGRAGNVLHLGSRRRGLRSVALVAGSGSGIGVGALGRRPRLRVGRIPRRGLRVSAAIVRLGHGLSIGRAVIG